MLPYTLDTQIQAVSWGRITNGAVTAWYGGDHPVRRSKSPGWSVLQSAIAGTLVATAGGACFFFWAFVDLLSDKSIPKEDGIQDRFLHMLCVSSDGSLAVTPIRFRGTPSQNSAMSLRAYLETSLKGLRSGRQNLVSESTASHEQHTIWDGTIPWEKNPNLCN